MNHPDAQDAPGDSPRIGQIVGSSPASRARAEELDQALGRTTWYEGPAADALPRAWHDCDLIVSHLALGATTRIIAPLLQDKKTDPGVVVIDEAGRFAVPLVGGHAGGANELATRIARALDGTPVVTTATDSLGIPALDTLGWAYRGDVAGTTRALLDGKNIRLEREHRCPLPPLPGNVIDASAPATTPDHEAASDSDEPAARIVVTDRAAEQILAESDLPTVVLHPRTLVIGMGCNSGTDVDHLAGLLENTLAEAGLARESVAALTTIDLKAGELGLIQLAARLGLSLEHHPAEELAHQDVPTPSTVVDGHVGSPSVSEASVLARGADLVVPKHKTTDATCAIGRLPARGRLWVVGLGPGVRDLLTPRAVAAIREATFVVGYAPYVRQIRDLVRPGVEIYASKMGTEQARTSAAIDRARAGESVALVCGGDPAVYAMASPVLEQGTDGIDVHIVPGVTAGLAASAILGAPLGHDHAIISLSDLHTTWQAIERRVVAAAEGDLIVALYNPRSRTRTWQLPRVLEIMADHRPADTPVAVVMQAERARQRVIMSTLADFTPDDVDMNSLVIIGSSTTTYVTSGGGEKRIVTPRDYSWMPETTTQQNPPTGTPETTDPTTPAAPVREPSAEEDRHE
ncbi:precorrin-3B C(17)-methyltransferase [Austwickia chelonae]|uniref:precorrin-3B C(17)-methyltransferase n=1 Tax=Austwickia chelonae TaxID=100225 RepID=UPI000E244C18|nr:precorrin-3B C(17)-methyltransferase [Austwickia chelonae]